ncbi:DUF4365 domain-containing protein [Rossellomorea sp. SC111]|uniref:DUF4365 domain-containing protein n=1 Tax=Rossellomorea sp. SC111 TaxID=2968985 RepID=UPI00215B542C|nr:DUF4365 domain-containing protein [Rossellomorea sp. SC111]MCR8848347.1 DUF4365 domain-containing protein [Rossellomorea sp. SC111]
MVVKKDKKIDSTIIEHMACLEINNLILQPPFHLISNVQWNDKGLSFDGDIEVYSKGKIKKSNFIKRVPLQIKGTTTYKKINKKEKIKHNIDKKDIEVYYKEGNGVLYFVVTINPTNYSKQAYYRILAPLDLKSLLSQLESSGNNSITVSFKKLEKGTLESKCNIFINVVEKQPKHYIETSKETEIFNFKLSFVDIKENTFNLFEETAYVYGSTIDNLEIPLELAKIQEIRKVFKEVVTVNNNEEINVTYKLIETGEKFKVVIEDTLTFEIYKEKKKGKFHFGKLKTLSSYLKSMILISYYAEHGKLPFLSMQINGKVDNEKVVNGIKEDIKWFKELIEICKSIGICENYLFHDKENLPSLFNGIVDIFKNERYELLDLFKNGKTENTMLCNIKLSDYVTVKLMYLDNKFINFYGAETLSKIGGFIQKSERKHSSEKGMPDIILENWEEDYRKVSIYISQNVQDMVKDANFNFDVIRLSFTEEYHDIGTSQTIDASLNYINYYDISNEDEYLNFALDLNQRYVVHVPNDDIPMINIYLIKLKQNHKLTDKEQGDILDIQERAEKEANHSLRFACEVLFQNKVKAQRIFGSLGEDEKRRMSGYPIYHFYESLK